ncbi:hypothetical protein BTR23_21285 [Alkalihalophilus pseudofirmus]|nr:hypothetical protein BTR23_21285 [Alkalihalophilus pseudofirmus]
MENTLKLILSELKEMRSDIDVLKDGQHGLAQNQREMQSDISVLKAGQTKLELSQQEIHADIVEVKEGVEKLNQNIIDSLSVYTEKIVDHVDDKTAALNKRVLILRRSSSGLVGSDFFISLSFIYIFHTYR